MHRLSFYQAVCIIAFFVATISGGVSPVLSASEKDAHTSQSEIDLDEINGLKSLSACRAKLYDSCAAVKSLSLYEFHFRDRTSINVLAFPAKSKLKLAVHFAPAHTQATSKQAKSASAIAAVNGGYFNLSDGVSASYAVINGVSAADPKTNRALTENPKLLPFLPQIFDRSELRLLQDKKSELHYVIAAHSEKLPPGMKLIDSLQGGPRLLPELTAEREAFIRHEADGTTTDSIGVMRTAARTAIGLTEDGQVLVVSVAGKKQSEFSAGLDLATLAKLLKNLGAREALNFDGGTSTTMVLQTDLIDGEKAHADGNYQMLVGLTPETRVKSTLCIVERNK